MEILSPAGSMEVLYAAVQSGADAVYIGGTEFSARRSAANFTLTQISEALKYCHLRGVKLHVAANILIKETEKESFLRYIGKLNDIGVDAVIIQDIGMAAQVRKMYPDLPLHASTQMTVTNLAGALMLQKMGFSRVVLARELSKSAIEKICKETEIETEVFAHGAICMCYSGQCLLSSMIGGRSGNRGMCAQPCRLPYEFEGKSGYFLSPKDLAMVDDLRELSALGVTSVKIEGRLKRKEYVAAVTSIYKKYAESNSDVTSDDKNALLSAFNRSGFTNGYFEDKLGKAMMSISNPSNVSTNVFSDQVKSFCRVDANFRKSEVYISAKISVGAPIRVCMWDDDGHFATYTGDVPLDKCKKGEVDGIRIEKQLIKLGNTPFFANSAEVVADKNAMISISEINDARRKLCELFAANILEEKMRRSLPYIPSVHENYPTEPYLVADVLTVQQAEASIMNGITEIYAPSDICNAIKEKYPDVKLAAKMPPVMRDDRAYLPIDTDRVLVSNIGEICKNKRCIGDYHLNVTNSESVAFFRNLERITLSPELNIRELSRIAEGNEIIAYGRLSLMLIENCPIRSSGKCQKGKIKYSLYDRMGERFPLKCSQGCVCELLNSKPIYMADKLSDLIELNPKTLRLIFTVENFGECGKIIGEYKKAMECGEAFTPPQNSFTRGHFYRGVE